MSNRSNRLIKLSIGRLEALISLMNQVSNDNKVISLALSCYYQYRFSACLTISESGIYKSRVLRVYLIDNLLLNVIGIYHRSQSGVNPNPSRVWFYGGEVIIFYNSSLPLDKIPLDILYDSKYIYALGEPIALYDEYISYIKRLLREITLHQECINFNWYLTDPKHSSLEYKTRNLLDELNEVIFSSNTKIQEMLNNYPYELVITLVNGVSM